MSTPARSFRVPDRIWDAAQAVAAERSTTVTNVLVEALKTFIAEPEADSPAGQLADVGQTEPTELETSE